MESYLRRAGYRVAIAHDGLSALRGIRDLRPALVVLDLMLPELDGRSVARTAREEADCSIIMLTALGSTAQRVLGLDSGADDYMAKPFAPSELVARVRSVLRRRRPGSAPGAVRYGDLVVDSGRHLALLGGRQLDLTLAEFDLLRALVEARGRVLTRNQLIDAIHPDADAAIHDRSIDVYVRRLRAKLAENARSQGHVLTVRGVGYRLREA